MNSNPIPSWMEDAACLGLEVELFFPTGGTPDGTTRLVRAMCAACPVSADCLDYAMEREAGDNTRHGIWGGTTPRQRRIKAATDAASDQEGVA